MPGVVKEFREFIARGNVIDLAVAVVIGAAFTGVVDAVVEGMLTPLVGVLISRDFSDMTFTLNDSTFFYGTVINAALQFLLVSAAVFFLVVKPMNLLNQRFRRGEEAPPPSPPTDEAVLLAEIRDLLRHQAGGPSATATGAAPPPGPPWPPGGTDPLPPPPGTAPRA